MDKPITMKFDKRIPAVADVENIDLNTLDRDELLKVAWSYKRAYEVAKTQNQMWKARQSEFLKWFHQPCVPAIIDSLRRAIGPCPLDKCLTDFHPSKYDIHGRQR